MFIRICRIKIHMLGYPKIWRYPQRLDDHIPPGLNGRLRFNGGLHRAWLARRGPALARKMGRPTESEVTPCLQIFCLFWKVWDFIEFVQCWVLVVSGCFYVFLQFNFPLASDLTIGFASWWCFFWFFSLLRHRKIPLEGFQLSHLNFLMDCKGYIMWHTTWDAHPMVQEENPGRMYLSWRISWRLKWFVTMLWQCLESQRRRGYIQQLGDSHNDGTWRLRHELVVKRNDDSSSCLVSPLLADTVSPVQCKLFAGYLPWKKTGHLYCYLYFSALFCLMHTPYHPGVCWLISASMSTIAAKNTYCPFKMGMVFNL